MKVILINNKGMEYHFDDIDLPDDYFQFLFDMINRDIEVLKRDYEWSIKIEEKIK